MLTCSDASNLRRDDGLEWGMFLWGRMNTVVGEFGIDDGYDSYDG